MFRFFGGPMGWPFNVTLDGVCFTTLMELFDGIRGIREPRLNKSAKKPGAFEEELNFVVVQFGESAVQYDRKVALLFGRGVSPSPVLKSLLAHR
jgi:hypothetical protein